MTARPITLVTGATSGIGKAIAADLADAGHDVIALGRNREALAALAGRAGIRPLALDLGDAGALQAALADAPVDVLVNNAGIMPPVGPFARMAQADIDATLAINLAAVLRVTRLVLPGMIARGAGHVFFTGSIAGHVPYPDRAVYGATKAAVSGFAAALRCDLVGTGVRVTEIVAGRVQTALYRDALDARERRAMYAAFDALRPQDVSAMLSAVLAMPAHVDVARFDILPTDQPAGGSSAPGRPHRSVASTSYGR